MARSVRHRASRRVRPTAVLACGVVALTLLVAIGWYVTGGRCYAVSTPSMGRTAPVGTLLITRPVDLHSLHVGDVITFRAPRTGDVYSHRIVRVTADGVRTRGDINGVVDPWVVGRQQLVGRVVARWWGVGWVLRGLPLFLIGLALTLAVAAFVPARACSAVRQLGTSATFALVSAHLHPWVGLTRLGSATHGTHVSMRAVSTGVLPLRLADSHGGRAVRLVSGQVADVPVVHRSANGSYDIRSALALTPTWWVAVALICALPMLCSMALALRTRSRGGRSMRIAGVAA